jgi:hypothetical protein
MPILAGSFEKTYNVQQESSAYQKADNQTTNTSLKDAIIVRW